MISITKIFQRVAPPVVSSVAICLLSADELVDTSIATVAMEYSPHPINGGDPYIKFFTFNGEHHDATKRASPAAGPGARITKIDLDGAGPKFQPGMCMTCHGGDPRELESGTYPDDGRTEARFIPFDLASFLYSDISGASRISQESAFRKLNDGVLCSIRRPGTISYENPEVEVPIYSTRSASLPVSGVSGVIESVELFIDEISYPATGDATITLVSPSGTRILVTDNRGSLGRDFLEARFADSSFNSVSVNGSAPFRGSWRPEVPFWNFDGEDPNGTWTLEVADNGDRHIGQNYDSGFIRKWRLAINGETDAVIDLVEGWYGGYSLPNFFNDNFIPSGWYSTESRQEGGDHLYREVFARSCRACHVMQTTRRPYLDFLDYQEFKTFASLIASRVFDEGGQPDQPFPKRMPLAKRTFDIFWDGGPHGGEADTQAGILRRWLIDRGITTPPDTAPANPGMFIDQQNIVTFDGSEENSLAYYAAVDPFNQATNLQDWIASNGFGSSGGEETSAYYFNEADLGFGRRMFMRKTDDRIAYYVVNFATVDEAVQGGVLVPDDDSQQGQSNTGSVTPQPTVNEAIASKIEKLSRQLKKAKRKGDSSKIRRLKKKIKRLAKRSKVP